MKLIIQTFQEQQSEKPFANMALLWPRYFVNTLIAIKE